MKTKTILFSLMILVVFGCKQKTLNPSEPVLVNHAGPIRITGAYALYPLITLCAAEFNKVHPEIKFEIQPIGSVGGVSRLLKGEADLSMVSSELTQEADTQVWIAPVAGLGVVFIMNHKNPYYEAVRTRGLNKEILAELFSSSKKNFWGDYFGKPGKDPVHVYIRCDSSGASDIISRFFWIQPDELKGTGVSGDTGMIRAIGKDPLAIGYCNFIYGFDTKKQDFFTEFNIIPIDQDFDGKLEFKERFYGNVSQLERAMWTGRYPCALVRTLSLASKGKPKSKEITEFLKYMLTDGQNLVEKAGYIELHRSENKCRLFFLNSN